MNEATAKISWLPARELVARVARHLGYPTENARIRIVRYVKARRIRMRGRNAAGLLVYATGHGPIDWGDESIELCLDDLIEADLLPAPGEPEGPTERARQPADRAIAYLITGYLVEWCDWTPEMIRGMGRGEIDLGQAISEGVPAWGWHPLERRRKRIPSDHFRAEMIERKGVLPVSVAHQPKVVVDTHGSITTSPRQRSADYRGPRWEAIEIDFAALRQARPKRKPKCKLKRKPRRKAGPGRERIYNHEAITGAGNRVLARGRPDTKALFFEKIIAECRAAKIKLPPNIDVDDSLLRRVVGKLYDDAKDERHN